MRVSILLVPALVLGSLQSASAQTGTLDQTSPYPGTAQTAWFNGDAVSLTWQAQVKTGVAGQLEGVTIRSAAGTAGQTLGLRLKVGTGWNVTPPVFSTTVVKPTTAEEDIFVDMSASNIMLNVNDLYVIEMQGMGTGFGILGTYAPPPALPQYPEFLYLNGPGCFVDCGWRLAFQTWMNGTGGGGPVAFCDPGAAGVIACPCANPPSGADRGCNNSDATGGGSLSATGSATIGSDTLVFNSSNQTAFGTSILMQGTVNNGTGLPFGQGVRCVDGALLRLYVKSPGGTGGITVPGVGDPSVSGASAGLGDVIPPGQHRYYMVYYRDPIVLGGCPGVNTYNGTNAQDVTWN